MGTRQLTARLLNSVFGQIPGRDPCIEITAVPRTIWPASLLKADIDT